MIETFIIFTESFNRKREMEYIERKLYLDKIRPFVGKSLIKVLVGQRRAGKSYLLFQIMDLIKSNEPEKQIIYINKEQQEFATITNGDELLRYIKGYSTENKKVALFIDEIQEINSFETALRDLASRGVYDIYCTGSNANLLSGELATYLTGRYVEFKVFNLSYGEYLTFHNQENSSATFNNYLKFGGLPYLLHLEHTESVTSEYLKSIYHSIVLKDVVARFKIRNVAFLENLIVFLADNVGSLVSAKKISDYLKSQKINISIQVVIDYLSYLETSFLISKVKRSGIEGKRIFEIGEKYFFEDIGIRNVLVGYAAKDIHKILENIVYLHLRMAGYSVTVGVEGAKEIDFIAQKTGEKIYVQVAYMLHQQETIDREYGNLLSIPDNFAKYVVTMDELAATSNYQGIKTMHIMEFCLKMVPKS